MKRSLLTLIATLFVWVASAQVKTGIEVLKSQNFKSLEGLRVGLVTNATGVDNNLVSDIDILFDAPNVELVALYGPEHGVRGSEHAGGAVADTKDKRTGLPSYSLYGKNMTPTPEILKGVDVLVYDIQDIGCRSYTYISTLGNVMKAAAKNNIKVMVLDRPNPLGGIKIEGCCVEEGCFSFVSKFAIPYVYGLTVGELAMMLNEEGMNGKKKCDLTVIPMEGWERSMTYDQTGLEWVMPSPHIPDAITSVYYAISGIIGELNTISIGVGYTKPFRLFGASWINPHKLADSMNALQLPGYNFRPIYYKPFYSVGAKQEMGGVEVYITDYDKASLCDLQFYVAQELYKLYPSHDLLGLAPTKYKSLIDKICGSKKIRELFMKRHQWEDAKAYWNKDVEAFRELSKKYYLY